MGHPRNRVSPLPDGCAGSSDLPCASLALGSAIPRMANPDGPGRKRCNATASFTMIKHTEAPTASGPMATLVLGCGATSIVQRGRGCKRPRICPKRKKMAKLPLSPAGEIHTLGTRPYCKKAHKALCGVAGLERPSARFKGPLTSRKPRAPPLFGGRSPACAVSHARTHTCTHAHTTGVVRC